VSDTETAPDPQPYDFSDPDRARAYLRGLPEASGAPLDLATAALALAALDRPRVPTARYLAHLDTLASDVRAAAGAAEDAGALARAVATVLFDTHGYRGDTETYDDLQNANLMRVIDRRRGLPIALSILYLHAARAQGWTAHGVNFPAHFLVRLEAGGTAVIVDPFNAGQPLGAAQLRELLKSVAGPDAELSPALYAPADDRDVLLRLQNNIKTRQVRARNAESALATVGHMRLIAPEEPSLWFDTAMLEAELGHFGAAIEALQTTARLDASGMLQPQVAAMMQALRRKLN